MRKNTVLREFEVENNAFSKSAYQLMTAVLEENPELAVHLDFCSTPEQYFESSEKDIIDKIRDFCEAQATSMRPKK